VAPALDSGDFSEVFSRHGNDSSWLFELGAGVFGMCLIDQTIWKWAKLPRR